MPLTCGDPVAVRPRVADPGEKTSIYDAVEACTIDSAEEAAFAERLPDRMTLRLTTRRLDRVPVHVAEQLRRQPLRWRLDYVWALRDCFRALR